MTNWDEVVRQHAALVTRITLRILGRTDDVEDVCQDVFLEAYRFEQSSRVQNWAAFFSRVATLRAIDRLRSLRRTFPLTGSEPSSNTCSPPDAAIAGELAARLRQALAQLPPQQGLVFSLRYFESMSNAEIAETLNISSSAVSTALSKARACLDTHLNDVPQGGAK